MSSSEGLFDPVLAFLKASRLRDDSVSLKQAALGKFSTSLLADAKKKLWDHCQLAPHGLPFTSRRSSEKRSQASADLEDILAGFSKLDEDDSIPPIFCEAVELIQLPAIVSDPIGVIVRDNGASLKALDDKVQCLSDTLTNLDSSLSSLRGSFSATPLTNQGSTYAEAARSTPSATPSPSHGVSPFLSTHSRADNLVLFGLPEVSSLPELKESVDDVLTSLVGKSIMLSDLHRLGRSKKFTGADNTSAPRPRPVILKFSCPWDRRLVLNSVRKLKDYSIKGLFLRPDLSVEERKARREAYLKSKSTQGDDGASGTPQDS